MKHGGCPETSDIQETVKQTERCWECLKTSDDQDGLYDAWGVFKVN